MNSICHKLICLLLNIVRQLTIKTIITILVLVVLNPFIVEIVTEFTNKVTCYSTSVIIVADVILVYIDLVSVIQHCISVGVTDCMHIRTPMV